MSDTKQLGVAFTKAPCQIKRCDCAHASQDRMYGKGLRVMNPMKDGFRCTVCGKKH